jgi:hypothetical protein
MVLFGNLGHYDATAVEAVKAQGNEDDKLHLPKEHSIAEHDLAEIYLDWDVDNDDIREAILITWHIKSKKRLRTVWNPFPDGRRPILIGQFDHPADITQVRGQGVSEKLEGAQDEADAIHNIGIEAGKRGVAHVIVLKEGTRAEEEFGGEDDLLPGDVIITSTPDEDVKSVALGDPKAGLAAIELEEHTRVYVTRILGLDESRMGNVESGKRVTKAVGMATMREGRMIIKAALSSLSHMLSEAAYLTIDLYKRFTPMEAIYSVLDREEAEALIESVFSLSDVSSRSSFLVRINAQDAALIQENKQQEMMILSQALFPFYDRQANLIMQLASPELPPAAKKPLLMLIERMERGMEALLNTVDSVPNPEELLVKINELTKLLEATEGPPAIPEEPVQEGDSPSLVGDLGAGVT